VCADLCKDRLHTFYTHSVCTVKKNRYTSDPKRGLRSLKRKIGLEVFQKFMTFYITLHSQDPKLVRVTVGCWIMSYKYKNIYTVQRKFSHKKTQWSHMRLFKTTSTYIHQHCQLTLFYTTFKWMSNFLDSKYSSTE
jgi:hypothetical protein